MRDLAGLSWAALALAVAQLALGLWLVAMTTRGAAYSTA